MKDVALHMACMVWQNTAQQSTAWPTWHSKAQRSIAYLAGGLVQPGFKAGHLLDSVCKLAMSLRFSAD